MNRFSLGTFGVLTLLWSFRVQADPLEPVLNQRVYVYNLAHVPDKTVRMARDLARLVFAESGIELDWVDVSGTDEVTLDPKRKPLVLIIARGRTSFMADQNARGATVKGFAAWAFYDRVESFVAASGSLLTLHQMPDVVKAQVLGAVIAHELGHLLELPHSRKGIMQANWSPRNFNTPGCVDLRFTPEETRRLVAHLTSAITTPKSPR